jgi:hypothetical protein
MNKIKLIVFINIITTILFLIKHDLLLCIKTIKLKFNNFLPGSIQRVFTLKSFIMSYLMINVAKKWIKLKEYSNIKI